MNALETADAEAAFRPRYDTPPEEMDKLERQAVDAVKEIYAEPGIYAAFIEPDHPLSNFVRAHEARYFPEVTGFSAELEQNVQSFALMDTRPGIERIVQVGSVSGPGFIRDPRAKDNHEGTGFFVVDDLVNLGNFTVEEFREFYTGQGVDLDKCVAWETNIRVGRQAERFRGARAVELGYLAMINMIEKTHPAAGESVIFATANLVQLLSFQRSGIRTEPMMGRSDLITPESLLGRVSTPIAIPEPVQYKKVLAADGPETLPSIHFGVPVRVPQSNTNNT